MKNLLFLSLLIFIAISQYACDEVIETCNGDPEVLDCNYFSQNRTLSSKGGGTGCVDYRVECVMDINADIVIEAGVVIEFADGAGFYVRNNGSLSIEGKASRPVQMRAMENTKWKGLLFDSNSSKNKLDYCNISGAGFGSFNSNGDQAAVIIWGNSLLDINHCNIDNSHNYGLSAIYTNSNFTINNTAIANAANAPILILPSYMNKMNNSNTHANNAAAFVEVQINTDAITQAMTWNKLDVPYRVTSNVPSFKLLTIEDGMVTVTEDITIEFEAGTGLYVDDDGGLNMNPTTGNVLLTGVDKQAGAWKCVYFQFTQALNVLNNVTIEYAGNTYDNAQRALGFWGDPRVNISNITFNNITGCAITDHNNSANAPNPNLTNSNNHSYNNVSGSNACY